MADNLTSHLTFTPNACLAQNNFLQKPNNSFDNDQQNNINQGKHDKLNQTL